MKLTRFLFIGTKACGKSTLVSKLTDDVFSLKYIPTVGVDAKIIKRRGEKILLWDASGSEENIEAHIKMADVIFAVFDLTSSFSFVGMTKMVENLTDVKAKIVVVGTKADLHGASPVMTNNFICTSGKIGFNLDTFLSSPVKEEPEVKKQRCCVPAFFYS
jgi:small GTP-binding protein